MTVLFIISLQTIRLVLAVLDSLLSLTAHAAEEVDQTAINICEEIARICEGILADTKGASSGYLGRYWK